MIVPQTMRDEFAKDFASTVTDPDAALQRSIDRAYREMGDAWPTDIVDDGALFLAAHLRTVAKRGATAAAGPVLSQTVGSVSVTYAAPTLKNDAGALGSTAYGLEYLRMISMLPGARVFSEVTKFSGGGCG